MNLSALNDLDHELGVGDLSDVWTFRFEVLCGE